MVLPETSCPVNLSPLHLFFLAFSKIFVAAAAPGPGTLGSRRCSVASAARQGSPAAVAATKFFRLVGDRSNSMSCPFRICVLHFISVSNTFETMWPFLFCTRRLRFDYGGHHGNCFHKILIRPYSARSTRLGDAKKIREAKFFWRKLFSCTVNLSR